MDVRVGDGEVHVVSTSYDIDGIVRNICYTAAIHHQSDVGFIDLDSSWVASCTCHADVEIAQGQAYSSGIHPQSAVGCAVYLVFSTIDNQILRHTVGGVGVEIGQHNDRVTCGGIIYGSLKVVIVVTSSGVQYGGPLGVEGGIRSKGSDFTAYSQSGSCTIGQGVPVCKGQTAMSEFTIGNVEGEFGYNRVLHGSCTSVGVKVYQETWQYRAVACFRIVGNGKIPFGAPFLYSDGILVERTAGEAEGGSACFNGFLRDNTIVVATFNINGAAWILGTTLA